MQISGRCFDTKERCHTATADKRNSQFTREGKHIQEKVPLRLQRSSILTVWLHFRWPAEDISSRILSENTVSYG